MTHETGVTIMRMERGLDTGAMLAKAATPIGRKTGGELTAELAGIGARLIAKVLSDLPAHAEVPQTDDGVTYAHKIDKAESRLDFSGEAVEVERQIRAFAPAPGAFFELDGERFRVLAADVLEAIGQPGMILDDALTIACANGAIRPTLIQRAGRPAMDTAAFLRGRKVPAGAVLA